MERERLTRLVLDPEGVGREDLAALRALAEKYPWFSGAQLLRTAGERRSTEVLFDETLRTTSAHLPSRAALFDLTLAPEHRSGSLKVVKPEPLEPREAPKPLAMRVESEVLPPVVALVVEEPIELPEPPNVAEAAMVGAGPTALKDPVAEELDQQILEAAMAGAYDLTFLEQMPVPAATPAPEPSPAAEANAPERRSEVLAPPRISTFSRLRFTEWLEDIEQEVPPQRQVATTPVSVAASAEPMASPASDQPTLPPTELIDRFIRQETPEPKATTAFFTPQQAGKRSLDDTAGLVTETLARIYAKQGNLPKAIDTYRRLALKYPEKAAYFAALQKNLADQQIK